VQGVYTPQTCCGKAGYTKKKSYKEGKGVIRGHILKDREYNGQKKKDKQRSTQHYTEN